MVESTENKLIEQHTTVGRLLAEGYTNSEILAILQATEGLTAEEAQELLRSVYDSWASVKSGLNLQSEDERNWHQYLRMKLLHNALKIEGTPSQRLALQILDSLANIQGITTTTEQVVPLPIILVDAEEIEIEKE